MIKQLMNVKIPSLMGILLLLVGVGVTSYLVDQGIIFEGRAAPEKSPTDIAITNVSPTSFTVLYTTEEMLPGSLSYGTEKEPSEVALDDRDKVTGRTSASTIHHITIKNLKPNTTYYFSILSGDALFQNEGEPYTVKTASELGEPPNPVSPITGSVNLPEAMKGTELLVLFSTPGLQSRSALLQPDGSYMIPVSDLRTEDLSSYATLSDKTEVKLVYLASDKISRANVLLANTRPVPLVTFNQSYNFTISNDPLASIGSASGSAQQTFPESSPSSNQPTITIATPSEAETFNDQQPLFTGTAVPGEEILIEIHSDQVQQITIKAKTNGDWEYRPDTALTPGEHTITIKTRDLTGTLREFTRSFTVYAQGSQFIEPSVSPANTPTPTLSVATPTEAIITTAPTATPTFVPVTPGVTNTVPSPTQPPQPVAGSREVIIGGLLGIGTIITGLFVFFLTRGSTL